MGERMFSYGFAWKTYAFLALSEPLKPNFMKQLSTVYIAQF